MGWIQLDLSPDLLAGAEQVLGSHGVAPERAVAGERAWLACHLEGGDFSTELLAEFLAHEVMRGANRRVHFCLGRARPVTCAAWVWPGGGGFSPSGVESGGVGLVQAYRDSGLFRFHQHYYQQSPYPVERWKASYEIIDPAQLPGCLAPFLRPDFAGWAQDLGLTHFTRGLLGLGWHPRHIAGVMAASFRRAGAATEEAWREADFIARCSAALVHEKLDYLHDFDCGAVRQQGWCPEHSDCRVSLGELKQHLRTGSWEP